MVYNFSYDKIWTEPSVEAEAAEFVFDSFFTYCCISCLPWAMAHAFFSLPPITLTHLRLPHKRTTSIKLNDEIRAAVLAVPSDDDGPILAHSHPRGDVGFGRSVLPNTKVFEHLYDIRIRIHTKDIIHREQERVRCSIIRKMYPVEDITDSIESTTNIHSERWYTPRPKRADDRETLCLTQRKWATIVSVP